MGGGGRWLFGGRVGGGEGIGSFFFEPQLHADLRLHFFLFFLNLPFLFSLFFFFFPSRCDSWVFFISSFLSVFVWGGGEGGGGYQADSPYVHVKWGVVLRAFIIIRI